MGTKFMNAFSKQTASDPAEELSGVGAQYRAPFGKTTTSSGLDEEGVGSQLRREEKKTGGDRKADGVLRSKVRPSLTQKSDDSTAAAATLGNSGRSDGGVRGLVGRGTRPSLDTAGDGRVPEALPRNTSPSMTEGTARNGEAHGRSALQHR